MAYYGRWWVCSPSVAWEGFHPSALSQHLLTLCLDNRILTLLGVSLVFICISLWLLMGQALKFEERPSLTLHHALPTPHWTNFYMYLLCGCEHAHATGFVESGWPTRIISLLLPCGLCTFKGYQARLVEATSVMLWAIPLALVLLLPWIYQK